jgi:hypothetical protein
VAVLVVKKTQRERFFFQNIIYNTVDLGGTKFLKKKARAIYREHGKNVSA